MAASIFFKTGPNRGLVRDKQVRQQVSQRITEAFANQQLPAQPAHDLGLIDTPQGQLRLIVRHAVDLVMLTGAKAGHVVLIKRKFPPGAGKWAITGGLIDAGETPRQAALREAREEAGLLAELSASPDLADRLIQLGNWRIQRPFDIRGTAWLSAAAELGNGVVMRPGDLMAVTTVPFALKLPRLRKSALQAGDDAGGVGLFEIASLSRNMIAVSDHLSFIHAAMAAVQGNPPAK